MRRKDMLFKSAISSLVLIAFFLFSFFTSCTLPAFGTTEPEDLQNSTEVSDIIEESVPEVNDELVIDSIPALGGDCTLVINDGKAMLIDGGIHSAYPEIKATLEKYNIDKIDILIITHPHKDHIGGLEETILYHEIGKIYMIDEEYDSDSYYELMDIISWSGDETVYAKAGMRFDFANTECKILNPGNESFKNLNNNSIVLKMAYKDKSFLFVGDLEKKGEKDLLSTPYNLKADFLKVGHHGVDDASSNKFLNTVNPDYALIPSKKNHSYEKTLDKLLERKVKVYVSMDDYHIVFSYAGDDIKVSSYPSLTYEE